MAVTAAIGGAGISVSRGSENEEDKQDEERDKGEPRSATGLHDGQCHCSSTSIQSASHSALGGRQERNDS